MCIKGQRPISDNELDDFLTQQQIDELIPPFFEDYDAVEQLTHLSAFQADNAGS